MKLTHTELISSGVKLIMEHFENELVTLRKKNDKKLSENDTAFLRGQIDQTKKILRLREPDAATITETIRNFSD